MRDLFDFAFFPNLDDTIETLAELAQHEDWENEKKQTQPKPILRNYLNYTFRRLQEENKVIKLEDKACFNTGLATNNQEEIFAYFVPHNQNKKKWFFKSFSKESDYYLTSFNKLPEVASYFQKSSDLVYDISLDEPRVDYDHIINKQKNRERFPKPFDSMTDYQLQNAIIAGIKQAMKRVKRNYKTAIPQYFWDKNAAEGELQLLLPLCLSNPSKADVALAVKRTNNVYSVETILTLDMAYNNARLLARPDREWLQP
ncbi:MAG: hypothetical protein Fur0025_18580 [Oscillatoriaceae cyanobacterium]